MPAAGRLASPGSLYWPMKPPVGIRPTMGRGLADVTVGHWPLVANGGRTAFDISGRGNHGTLTGFAFPPTATSGWNPGRDGPALAFSTTGTDSQVLIGTGVMDFSADSGAFSVVARIRTIFDGANRYILGTHVDTGWYMRTHDAANDALLIKIDDGVYDEYAAGTTPLNDGVWHDIGLTLEGGGAFLGYVDGNLEITLTTGSVTTLADNLILGRIIGAADGFDGMISHVHIYNRALTASEIMELYLASSSKFDIEWWPWLSVVAGGPTYTLTVDPGSLTLSGQEATLAANRLLAAALGSISLSGQEAGLLVTRVLTADAGSLSLSGQDVNILAHRLLTTAVGTITLAGQDVTLTYTPLGGPTYTLTADPGSLTVSGQDIGLAISRLLTADSGSLTLTGQDVGLTYTALALVALTLRDRSVALTLDDRSVTLTLNSRYTALTLEDR